MTKANTKALSAQKTAGFRTAHRGPAKLPPYRAARSLRRSSESRKSLFFNEVALIQTTRNRLTHGTGETILDDVGS